jgi:hypothetical protein
LKALVMPLPDDSMVSHAVSKVVDNPRNEKRERVQPMQGGGCANATRPIGGRLYWQTAKASHVE